MKTNLIAQAWVSIEASPAQVWKALTTPALIKKFMMGTNVTSTWEEGDPIIYEGEYEGKAYKEKGVIKKLQPEKLFVSTYLTTGKEDKPDNYNLVTYKLTQNGNKTEVNLTQDNNTTEEAKNHSQKNWEDILKKLKEVVESQPVEAARK